MSLCEGSNTLLKSYGVFMPTNYSEMNRSIITANPVFHHWCHYGHVPKAAHFLVGTLLIVICTLSIIGNLLVVVVFSRYRRLRSPANTLIVNLAASDLLNGFLHPMAAYSSFKEHWMFGRMGCELYAALCGLFGLISIVTLTAIAIERCLVISVKPWYGGILFTQSKAKLSIIVIWAYCMVIISPPLIGWGAFVPEGFLTSCSFDYITRTPSNRSYFLYIFFFGFFLPVSIITICYSFIIRTIFQNERELKKNNVKKVQNKIKKRNDYKAAEMIMFVIAMFMLSWIPYSTVAIIGQFGNTVILTPWVSVLPSLFAKMSTIYNPAIYGLSHRHFRATLRRICKKELPRSSGDRGGTYLSRNSVMTRTRNGCLCLSHFGGSEVIEDSSSSYGGKKVYIGVSVTNAMETNRIIYVKKDPSLLGKCKCEELPKTCPIPQNNYKPSTYRSYGNYRNAASDGTPGIMTVQYDAAKMSLMRSLMFRSDSSINQKYQIYLHKDNIIRIPSIICPCASQSLQQNSNLSNSPQCGAQFCLPVRCIRILNIDPLTDVIPKENF